MEEQITIEYHRITELTPYENNARDHHEDDISAIRESIRAFGFNDPIGIWGEKNVVVEGHGRLIACYELGIEMVPCIRLDHLTDEERRAYAIAHNKTSELSNWDFHKLDLELAGIKEIDMSVFGFEFSDPEPEVFEDDFLEEPEESRVRLGDLWLMGEHRLVCGDATDRELIGVLMGGCEVDMIFTDPPYGMGLDSDFSSMKSRMFKGGMSGKKYEIGDVDSFSPAILDAILSIKSKECFIWGADYFAELIPDRLKGSWIVWDKRANGNDDINEDYSSDKMYGSCFELCWSRVKHKREIARVKWAGIFGTETEPDKARVHPTQKPVMLASWFLNKYSKEGQVILDLFGGSGSTLIACEEMNRKCLICELDQHYCDIIISRWENLTGRKAVKA